MTNVLGGNRPASQRGVVPLAFSNTTKAKLQLAQRQATLHNLRLGTMSASVSNNQEALTEAKESLKQTQESLRQTYSIASHARSQGADLVFDLQKSRNERNQAEIELREAEAEATQEQAATSAAQERLRWLMKMQEALGTAKAEARLTTTQRLDSSSPSRSGSVAREANEQHGREWEHHLSQRAINMAEAASLEAEQGVLVAEARRVRAEHAKLQEQYLVTERDREAKLATLRQLEAEKAALQAQVADARKKLQAAWEDHKSLESQLSTMESAISTKQVGMCDVSRQYRQHVVPLSPILLEQRKRKSQADEQHVARMKEITEAARRDFKLISSMPERLQTSSRPATTPGSTLEMRATPHTARATRSFDAAVGSAPAGLGASPAVFLPAGGSAGGSFPSGAGPPVDAWRSTSKGSNAAADGQPTSPPAVTVNPMSPSEGAHLRSLSAAFDSAAAPPGTATPQPPATPNGRSNSTAKPGSAAGPRCASPPPMRAAAASPAGSGQASSTAPAPATVVTTITAGGASRRHTGHNRGAAPPPVLDFKTPELRQQQQQQHAYASSAKSPGGGGSGGGQSGAQPPHAPSASGAAAAQTPRNFGQTGKLVLGS